MSKRRVGGRTSAGLLHPAISAMYQTQDLKEQLAEDAMKDWLAEERKWMERCAEVEGLATFQTWYDDDSNVPAFVRPSVRVSLLTAHYNGLKLTHADAFYWLEVESQEVRKCIQIEGHEGFTQWWNGETFPVNTTPKERVDLIRARITQFLTSAGTVQVQDRVRAIQQAIVENKATNRSEVLNELAELSNHLQQVGIPLSGDEGGSQCRCT